MITPVKAAALIGFSGTIIDIECDITQGLPNVTVVGLPTKAVDEAKERVRSAIRNSELTMPRARVTLNLAPAGLKKEGTGFDLPLAVAILQGSGQLEVGKLGRSLFVGELSLKGDVRPIPGILNYVEAAAHAGIEQVFVPANNALQASLVPGVLIYGIENLQQLQQHLTGIDVLNTTKTTKVSAQSSTSNL